ncbi:20395_t:CDS:2 [Gigaspora margarita]|uniref:20395_t:CDS:1 n=1 Tax=Gigaspora margarita TaxID=4874 RepID=A0ABM8W335_GIGMA|nr:20395_t:CDS:2 [Gigaspora margarita]
MSRNPETAAYWMKAQLTRRISDEIPDEIVALRTVGEPNDFSNILAELFPRFGVYTRPTNEQYYIIITYAESGKLHKCMRDNVKTLSWIDRLFIIWDIGLDLERIHKAELVHRNIHSGNVLHTREVCHYLRDIPIPEWHILQIWYFVEEVIGQNQTYISIGIIMWELTSGRQPFESVPHDMKLATDICNGLRHKLSRIH